MAVTSHELACFAQFASAKIDNGGVASLEECLRQWREHQEVNSAIDRGLADIEAGRFRPVEEFWTEFISRHDIAADQ